LLMEFHGSPASVKEQAGTVQDIASEHGGSGFQWATTPEERTKLWTARHHAYFAGAQMKPGCRTVSTDTCVPISRLAECVTTASEAATAAGMQHYIVGHVGDGNFHIAYLVDPKIPSERETAERLNNELVQRAIEVQGTCSGEHGIGLHKMDFLVNEAGAGSIAMMRTLKRALDPKNIMNPGKIFAL
jgi:D-lactate dehydrogenase (cytochrome)